MAGERTGSSIVSLIFGLVGGSASAALITFLSNSSIEEQKFSYSLIQQALEAESAEERRARLAFILDLDLISDPKLNEKLKEKVDKAQSDPKILPQLPQVDTGYRAPEGVYPQAFAIVGSATTQSDAVRQAKKFLEYKSPCEPRVYRLREEEYVVQLGGNLSLEQAEVCKSTVVKDGLSSSAFVFSSRSPRQEAGRISIQ